VGFPEELRASQDYARLPYQESKSAFLPALTQLIYGSALLGLASFPLSLRDPLPTVRTFLFQMRPSAIYFSFSPSPI